MRMRRRMTVMMMMMTATTWSSRFGDPDEIRDTGKGSAGTILTSS
jgi:hypothetical protein